MLKSLQKEPYQKRPSFDERKCAQTLKKTYFILALLLAVPFGIWLATHESSEHKIDREVGWREVKSYDVTAHGVEIGEVTVPRHTQRVTFFLWGVPKESYLDDDDQPRIIGEMDRDIVVNDPDDLSDLGRIALAAYNHGGTRVILTKHKAYLVTSDVEEDAERAFANGD